jgi:prophage antirepressor-like protein
MTGPLMFQAVAFQIVDHKGQTWLTMRDITAALYNDTEGGGQSDAPFANAEKSLKRLHKRHAREFTADMTSLVKVQTTRGMQMVRIFSLRGAYLLGMFARTPKAEAFRRWVLDVLEGVTHAPADLHARLLAAEREEARSFAQASNAARTLAMRRRAKPLLLEAVTRARAEVQMVLALEGGAA